MNKQIMKRTLGIAASAALALGASAVSARAGTTNGLDRQFAIIVGQGNVAEVQASRLALKKSSNLRVRQIAQMMVTQHGQAQQDLLKAGRQSNVKVAMAPDPMHKAAYKMLSHLTGPAFDKAYLKGLVHDHFATVGLFQKEMANGDDTNIHSFAAEYLPGIQTHTKMITDVASNMGIRVASADGIVTGTNGMPGHPGKMSKMGHTSSASMPPAGGL